MKWKNWPYWLKGGIVGLVAGIFIEALLFFVTNYCLNNSSGGDWFGLLVCYYIFMFPGMFLTNDVLIAIIINILVIIIFSIVIGLIIGKIKSKQLK